MRRALAAAALIALAIAAIVWWRRDRGAAPAAAPGEPTSTARPALAGADRLAPDDPRTRPRGQITGAVRARDGGPIAARVCATWSSPDLGTEETRAPIRVAAGADGRYALTDLAAGAYRVHALAPRFAPAVWRAPDRDDRVRLRAGEVRAAIDLVLDGGAVELRGIVVDVNGGPIAGALVTSGEDGWWSPTPVGGFVRSADDGTFALWVKPGAIEVQATADGYAATARAATAPGCSSSCSSPPRRCSPASCRTRPPARRSPARGSRRARGAAVAAR